MNPESASRLPSYLRVKEVLRDRIRAQSYRSGEFIPPERTLASELGVSRVTIRQAIDLLRQEGFLAPEHGRGTRVTGERDEGALAQRPFMLAALIIYGIDRDSSAAIFRGCQSVMSRAGYHLILCETPRETSKRAVMEAAHLRSLIDKRIPGIIIYPTSENHGLIEEALANGIRVVQIDRYLSGVAADYVGVDNLEAASGMVDHLIQLGCRRIAFLTIWPEPSSCQERLRGYQAALRAHGLDDNDTSLLAYCDTYTLSTADVDSVLERWLALPDPPDAIFAVNDALAMLVMQRLQRLGKRVPEEVAVVGFDNERLASIAAPSLTTIQQPFEPLGEVSAKLMLERISGVQKEFPRRVLLPTRIVVRQSCGAEGRTVPAGPPRRAVPMNL